jgi:hypothetical protein
VHVEVLIYKAYIVEEISTFISHYFKSHLRTRIKRVILRHDDGREVPSSENLSIFFHPGRLIQKKYCEEKIFDKNRIQINT